MEAGFKIEVKKYEDEGWTFYEEFKRGNESVRNYLRLIRTAYPDYWVRALDISTGEVVDSLQTFRST